MRVCVRVFSVGFGPGLDSMSPARSRRSASHATAGFPKKLGGRASGEAGCRWIQFAQCSPGQCPRLWHTNHEQAVSVWCPDVSLASASLITSCSWQTLSTLSSDHLPILIRLQMKTPSNPGLRRTYVNL